MLHFSRSSLSENPVRARSSAIIISSHQRHMHLYWETWGLMLIAVYEFPQCESQSLLISLFLFLSLLARGQSADICPLYFRYLSNVIAIDGMVRVSHQVLLQGSAKIGRGQELMGIYMVFAGE
jgi:hypothetical protein